MKVCLRNDGSVSCLYLISLRRVESHGMSTYCSKSCSMSLCICLVRDCSVVAASDTSAACSRLRLLFAASERSMSAVSWWVGGAWSPLIASCAMIYWSASAS